MIKAALLAVALCPNAAMAEGMVADAWFEAPTTRYAHGILGDAEEWGTLVWTTDDVPGSVMKDGARWRGLKSSVTLHEDHVFEDVAPRLWDVTGDGHPEIVVIETDVNAGAALAIYNQAGKIAQTPHIGRRNRWLAPLGAADLDGDGNIEIAYIDRPHLAKTLRVWRFKDGGLHPVADLAGLTNHRIGETDIAGGIRDCGQGLEVITANADWSQIMATSLSGGKLTTRSIMAHRGRASFDAALNC